MTKFCLPIQVPTWAEFLSALRGVGAEYDLVELWMDYLDDWDLAHWRALSQHERKRVIVVWRRDQLVPTRLPPEVQSERMRVLLGECAYVDVDLRTQGHLFDRLSPPERSERLLLSHHDYQATPSTEGLRELLGDLRASKPAGIKLATLCRDESDALRLLQLLLEARSRPLPTTILGMGAPGTMTRVLGALWGNALSFAPHTQAKSSAPGQLTLAELKAAMAALARDRPKVAPF